MIKQLIDEREVGIIKWNGMSDVVCMCVSGVWVEGMQGARAGGEEGLPVAADHLPLLQHDQAA